MTRPALALSFVATLLAAGCNGDATLSGTGGEEAFSEYDGAMLVVNEPLSGDIYLRDEGLPFEGMIVDAEGAPLPFDDIVWTTDLEDGELLVGASGQEFVGWGIHTITATADLPNGDRLVYTAGGVRVQGEHTGVYAGNLNITLDAEFQGTPVSGSCNGGLDFVVDMSGTVLDGGGGCTVDLIVLGQFDVDYVLDASVFDDDAEGNIGVDVGFFELPLEWDGRFENNSDFEADFAGGALLFDMEGTISATRVSPYVEPSPF